MTRTDGMAKLPRYRAGETALPGTCRVCGMHDPDGLTSDSHPSCVEWLGYTPTPPRNIVADWFEEERWLMGRQRKAIGVITLPTGMSRREAAEFAATYAQIAAGSRPFVTADGSVEMIYQHPSARAEETT